MPLKVSATSKRYRNREINIVLLLNNIRIHHSSAFMNDSSRRLASLSAACKFIGVTLSTLVLLFGKGDGLTLLAVAAPVFLLALADAAYTGALRAAEDSPTDQPYRAARGFQAIRQTAVSFLMISVLPFYALLGMTVWKMGNVVAATKPQPMAPGIYPYPSQLTGNLTPPGAAGVPLPPGTKPYTGRLPSPGQPGAVPGSSVPGAPPRLPAGFRAPFAPGTQPTTAPPKTSLGPAPVSVAPPATAAPSAAPPQGATPPATSPPPPGGSPPPVGSSK